MSVMTHKYGGPSVLGELKPLAPMTTLDFRTIAEATRKVVNGPAYSASGLGLAAANEDLQSAANVLTAAGLMLIVRGVAGYYVGSKMGRPVGGAVLGSIFGPLGLGVLSFWSK